jgi:hypothetical protein
VTAVQPSDRPVRLTRHADHDPVLICRPALGYGLCEVLTCRIDWRALDLEPPDELDPPARECPALGECRCPAVYRVVQGCPHEHIVQAVACGHCVAVMRSYEPFDRWACGACLRGADGHQCTAPVLVELIRSDQAATG